MKRSHTLVLLLAAYICATFMPGPGLFLHDIEFFSDRIQLPEVLLGLLLLSAGLCAPSNAASMVYQVRREFFWFSVASWMIPSLAAVLVVALLWGVVGAPASVALGVIVVASMPVANSSVGWAAFLRGNVALSLTLLLTATAMSPLLSPLIISTGATIIGTAEAELKAVPWNEGMSAFFLTWVLTPVLLGLVLSRHLKPSWKGSVERGARNASFGVLIALNYINGSACLPTLIDDPQFLLWPIMTSLTFLFICHAMSAATELWMDRTDRTHAIDLGTRRSLELSALMRNTGAALVFAGENLPEFALVSITIISQTMLQHLYVGLFVHGNEEATVSVPAENEVTPVVSLNQSGEVVRATKGSSPEPS